MREVISTTHSYRWYLTLASLLLIHNNQVQLEEVIIVASFKLISINLSSYAYYFRINVRYTHHVVNVASPTKLIRKATCSADRSNLSCNMPPIIAEKASLSVARA